MQSTQNTLIVVKDSTETYKSYRNHQLGMERKSYLNGSGRSRQGDQGACSLVTHRRAVRVEQVVDAADKPGPF